jgi:endonuclease/exonuclease/phosphatase family metal-dependent hydrolase
MDLRLLSYNIHRCIGDRGRQDVARVAGVIRALHPDVVALQEVQNGSHEEPESRQLDYLAAATGLTPLAGPTLRDARGDYGNALLTRLSIRTVRRVDLSVAGREPRGALDVELALGSHTLRLIATHLGLQSGERRRQLRQLLTRLGAGPEGPSVLMGDLNLWWPLGPLRRRLRRFFGHAPLRRTFPAGWPLLPLDRILVAPSRALLELEAVRLPATRRASDHLPLLARIRWP